MRSQHFPHSYYSAFSRENYFNFNSTAFFPFNMANITKREKKCIPTFRESHSSFQMRCSFTTIAFLAIEQQLFTQSSFFAQHFKSVFVLSVVLFMPANPFCSIISLIIGFNGCEFELSIL